MPAHWRFTVAARADVATILRQSRQRFGQAQARRYAALIVDAAEAAVLDPDRPGVRNLEDIEPGLRALPIGLVAMRRSAAAHVLYFRRGSERDRVLPIVRVLHERMDPARHLGEESA